MARGHFVGLFLRKVARQATAAAGTMVGEFGGRALAWKRSPGRNSQGFFLRRRTLDGSYQTLSALGRCFGLELDEICSSLIGSAGCKIPGLVWFLRER